MYKYTLHKEKKKQTCPNCQKRRFVRYIDTETGELLPDKVGRCDREINCSYHLTPKEYFKNNGIATNYITTKKIIKIKPSNFHNYELVNSTNKKYDENNFVQFLHSLFDSAQVQEIIRTYKIGTSKHWKGATIFWQIDICKRVRGGKIMLYDKNTGKRSKFFTWVHSIYIKIGAIHDFNLKQCLFGLHLTGTNDKLVAIVESEKTACIMSQIFKKYTWLATGGLSNLNKENLEVLKHKKIILYPDLGIDKNGTPYDKWSKKVAELKKEGFDIAISDLLENNGTQEQRIKGYDIADYFLDKNKNLAILNHEYPQ